MANPPNRRFTNRTTNSKRDKRYNAEERALADKAEEERLRAILPAIYSVVPEEPKDFNQFPTEAKLWARAAWWSGKYSATEIAEMINVKDSTVYTWIRGHSRLTGWAEDKEKADKRALSGAVRKNTTRMDSLMTKILDVLENTVRAVIEENRRLSVDEFTKMANAFEKIFKLRQLELGRPTEIFAGEDGKIPSWSEIRAKMEEVDYIEVS